MTRLNHNLCLIKFFDAYANCCRGRCINVSNEMCPKILFGKEEGKVWSENGCADG